MALFRPMYEMARKNIGRLRLNVPGHKGQAPFDAGTVHELDTTELPQTDDLYAPSGPIKEAQALWAKAAGAGDTLMLTGGSTAGILTMLLYSAGPGDTVILPRNAHLSCMSGCVLADLNPAYVPLSFSSDGYGYAAEEGFLQAIKSHPHARAVLVTRPDYYGVMIGLERIAKAAHEKGMRLLVDEAHGAHLPWMKEVKSASEFGADLWVQSAHKTLPALTSGALLHLKKGEDAHRARRMLRLVQTSSPAFYVLQSLDDARAFMDAKGNLALEKLATLAAKLRQTIAPLGYTDMHMSLNALPFSFDATRLVITAPQGGYSLEKSLGDKGIDVEMADDRRVVCVLTVMDGEETVSRLESALLQIPAADSKSLAQPAACTYPIAAMRPRQAALSQQELVSPAMAAGRISGTSVGLYPPGIPLAAPGEIITPEIVELLYSSPEAKRFGLCKGQFLCAKES